MFVHLYDISAHNSPQIILKKLNILKTDVKKATSQTQTEFIVYICILKKLITY